MQQGHNVGMLARRLFPGGVEVCERLLVSDIAFLLVLIQANKTRSSNFSGWSASLTSTPAVTVILLPSFAMGMIRSPGRTSERFNTVRDAHGNLVSISSSDPGLLIGCKK
jgi:hypothetical protein